MSKLDEVEAQLGSVSSTANAAALAERHIQLSGVIVEVTTPALREGYALLERVGRDDPGARGVLKVVSRSSWRFVACLTVISVILWIFYCYSYAGYGAERTQQPYGGQV
jgi:hypothetical protein